MPGDWGTDRYRRLPGEPHLEPLFPITAFRRANLVRLPSGEFREVKPPCPHKKRIKRGSCFVCMECHQSGMDHRGALARDPKTDPKPEPKPSAPKAVALTHKEKRSLVSEYLLRANELTRTEKDFLKTLGVEL